MPGRSVRLGALSPGVKLQGSAHVADSVLGMVGIHHFEYHVVAGFKLSYDGIELILCSGGLLVDACNHESGLETLQVSEGTGANRLDDDAGDVQFGGGLIGDLANDHAELASPASLTLLGVVLLRLAVISAKTLSRSPMVTVVSWACRRG